VVGVLFIVIGGMALVLADTGRNVWARTDAQLATLTDAQRALDRLNEDLGRACQSTLNPASCAATDQLVFKLSPSCATGSAITYMLTGSNLTRQVGAAAPVTVASGLTKFDVQNCSGGLVKVALTAQANTVRGPFSQTLESQIWVRNP
jgi:hypothetical protein